MFVLVGGTPNTAWLHHQVKLDHDGFVCTGAPAGVIRRHETSCPGMFVVGDVRAGSVKRVASAAGEGSVLIAEIHQHLAAQSEPVLIHPNRREDYPGTMHDLMSPG
jgi:thioredoxin reductase (NADPH)